MTALGWFADVSSPGDEKPGLDWQPFLQFEGGCLPLPVWFATEDEVGEFMDRHVLNQPLLD